MVNITMVSEDIDDVTGKRKKVKLKITFWSVMKMYLIGWFIVTAIILGITLLVRQFVISI